MLLLRVTNYWCNWSTDNRNLFLISSVTEAAIYGSYEGEFVVCFIRVVTYLDLMVAAYVRTYRGD